MKHLTKDFHQCMELYTKSMTATRHGIDNTPDENVLENLIKLHSLFVYPCYEKLTKIIGEIESKFVITSGFRCLKLNRKIGSKDTSQHVHGQAVDFEIVGLDNNVLYNFVKKEMKFDQCIREFYKESDPQSGWIHVSYVDERVNRQQSFTIE